MLMHVRACVCVCVCVCVFACKLKLFIAVPVCVSVISLRMSLYLCAVCQGLVDLPHEGSPLYSSVWKLDFSQQPRPIQCINNTHTIIQ